MDELISVVLSSGVFESHLSVLTQFFEKQCHMKNLLTLMLFFFFPLSVNAFIPDTPPTVLSQKLAAGDLLIASEHMKHGFRDSVILLIHYSQDGAIGLILNRPSNLHVNDVVPGLVIGNKAGHLFFGGPVKQRIISVLVKAKKEVGRLRSIMPNVYFDIGVSKENAGKYILSDSEVVRFYSGYAGWGKGQLESEINRGDWYVLKGDPAILFDVSTDFMWGYMIHKVKAK
jgi:putative transcriptional regulator